jgi:outer membrane protein assembly complex protein YaeT
MRSIVRTPLFFALLPACLAAAPLRADEKNGEDPPRLTSLEIRGNEAVADEDIRKSLPMKEGGAYNPGALSLMEKAALIRLRARGYLEAEATARAEVWESSAAVTLSVKEGPLHRFGPVEVRGLSELPERAVRRELPFREGDPYDPGKLYEAQSRLYGLGLFQEAEVAASTAPGRAAPVTVRVRERPHQWLKGGVGWGSEERQRLSLAYSNHNFLRRAYFAELSGTYSALWLEFKAELVNRYLFGTRTEQRTQASWRHEEREGYELEKILGRVSLGRRLTKHIHAAPGYRLQRTLVFNVDPAISATTPEKSLTSGVDLGLNWDNTDDFFFPTRGVRAGLTLERTGGALGGDVHFNKATANAATYQSLWRRVVGVASARAGAARPFQPSREVPVFERLFIGGARTLRGYRERGVGPRSASGDPLGGEALLGANAEIRFPIYWRFWGAVFADAGQVANHAGGVRPSEWKRSTGCGLRFRTPVGPFRLDYGYKLNPDPGDEDLWRLHFSLGEAF